MPWREGWSTHTSQGEASDWRLQGCCSLLHSVKEWQVLYSLFLSFGHWKTAGRTTGASQKASRLSYCHPRKGAGLEAIYILVRCNSTAERI